MMLEVDVFRKLMKQGSKLTENILNRHVSVSSLPFMAVEGRVAYY